MEYNRDDRCCDYYYEKDRIVYEEPHLRHQHHHNNLFNHSNHVDDSFRFKEERRFEDKYGHGGHVAGGETRVVTYKVEETDYSFDEADKARYARRIF